MGLVFFFFLGCIMGNNNSSNNRRRTTRATTYSPPSRVDPWVEECKRMNQIVAASLQSARSGPGCGKKWILQPTYKNLPGGSFTGGEPQRVTKVPEYRLASTSTVCNTLYFMYTCGTPSWSTLNLSDNPKWTEGEDDHSYFCPECVKLMNQQNARRREKEQEEKNEADFILALEGGQINKVYLRSFTSYFEVEVGSGQVLKLDIGRFDGFVKYLRDNGFGQVGSGSGCWVRGQTTRF